MRSSTSAAESVGAAATNASAESTSTVRQGPGSRPGSQKSPSPRCAAARAPWTLWWALAKRGAAAPDTGTTPSAPKGAPYVASMPETTATRLQSSASGMTLIGRTRPMGSLGSTRCGPLDRGPLRLPSLGEESETLDLVGMPPHGDELRGARLAGVREPLIECAPQGTFGGRHGGRRIAGDLLGEGLGLFAQAIRRVDHLADHAQCECAVSGHALVAPDQRHALDRRDHRLPHLMVPGGEVKIDAFARLAIPLEPDAVRCDLDHVGARLERL